MGASLMERAVSFYITTDEDLFFGPRPALIAARVRQNWFRLSSTMVRCWRTGACDVNAFPIESCAGGWRIADLCVQGAFGIGV